jgi:hypothetical protein
MVPAYDRAGPDGLDLQRTRTIEVVKTGLLQGYGAAIVRVTVDQSGETPQTVIWRNEPTDDQKEWAEALIGSCEHSW